MPASSRRWRATALEGADEDAISRLLGMAARWAERRDRVTARFELIDDLVTEAAVRARQAKQRRLTDAALVATLTARRQRNTRLEDRVVRSIVEGAVLIDTAGVGDRAGQRLDRPGHWRQPVRHAGAGDGARLGRPQRDRQYRARCRAGGPIQQKGAMVLQGFLASRFAQLRPLSFTCSITFEQSYGGVEGDSASMAELIAVLSDLAQLPIRQDIAITGSVNQAGRAQAIGGAHWKIEGFFRVCQARPGGLTGTQGVIVPEANRVNLVLRDDVAAAIRAGRFHLWSVASVEEVVELLIGVPAGVADGAGDYPAGTVFGGAAARLTAFDRILAERQATGFR